MKHLLKQITLVIFLSLIITNALYAKTEITLVDESPTYQSNLGMTFKYLKPGTFTMGSTNGDSDEKPHQVTLTNGFYIQTKEVTQQQWKIVMTKNPSKFSDCGNNCPVENISWNDIQEFIEKLNKFENGITYRLPTESEWEYACRAGSDTKYANNKNIGELGWFNRNSKKKPHPAGEKETNDWGLYDMHGNVWEWCATPYNDYPKGDVIDPQDPENGYYKVFRGGSWDASTYVCRAANRLYKAPDFKRHDIGFRLVMMQ